MYILHDVFRQTSSITVYHISSSCVTPIPRCHACMRRQNAHSNHPTSSNSPIPLSLPLRRPQQRLPLHPLLPIINTRRPTSHPPTHPPPPTPPPRPLLNHNLPIRRLPIQPKLHTHTRIQRQHPRSTQPKRKRSSDPRSSLAPALAYPAVSAVRRVRSPSAGVGDESGGVEEVSAEGGGEELRGEARGRFAEVVFVELGEAGAEVEDAAEPGEDRAGLFEGSGVGC